ncbi:MAG: FHA domain-containing protein [Chitinivibrionales bacterium]|nr:FHA domain-containing protein [Chitinivibrionales bacterium]MBD3394289.1 FHA domain-containing protein [Chitinivibrionales bacterium]
MVRCVVCHNDEAVKTYEIEDPLITIGRLPENTISIANMGVSRRHVRIERDINRNYVLTDLDSLNGTFVNDKKVKKTALATGDKIAIGKYTIILEEISVDDAPTDVHDPASQEPAGSSRPVHAPVPPAAPQPRPDTVQPKGPVLIDTGKHTVYPINKRVMSLGNSESDDIFISGFLIGDGHLLVEKRTDGIWLSAAKKSAKFKVNGKKTGSHCLKHKDRIEIGSAAFAFMENG